MSPIITIVLGVGLVVALVVVAGLIAHMANLHAELELWKSSASWWRGLYRGKHPWQEKTEEEPAAR